MKSVSSFTFKGQIFQLSDIIKEYHLEQLSVDELFRVSFQDVVKMSGLTKIHFCILHRLSYRYFLNIVQQYPSYTFLQLIGEYFSTTYQNFILDTYNYCGVSIQAICLQYYLNYISFCNRFCSGKTMEESLAYAILGTPFYSQGIAQKIYPMIPRLLSMNFNAFRDFCLSDEVSEELVPYLINFYQKKLEIEDAMNVYYIVDFVKEGYLNIPSMREFTQQEVLNYIGLSEEEYKHYTQSFYEKYESVMCKGKTIWVYSRKRNFNEDN